MARHAAFLRAVNLGSTRKAGSEQLRSVFEDLGFEDVATFRTSGNVVFEAGREKAAKLTDRIETGIAEELGFEVVIFLRSASEVRAIAQREPFPAVEVEASNGKVQVMMLPAKPAEPVQQEVLGLATVEDRLAFAERELYWLPSGGTQRAALDQKALGTLLGPTTMRTKGTVELMAAKYFAAD
jgi:uncharacterized protein (DUF1697 family)